MKHRSSGYKAFLKKKEDAEDDRVLQQYRGVNGPLFQPTERYVHLTEMADVDQLCHMCDWVGRPARPQLCPDCGTRDVPPIAADEDRNARSGGAGWAALSERTGGVRAGTWR